MDGSCTTSHMAMGLYVVFVASLLAVAFVAVAVVAVVVDPSSKEEKKGNEDKAGMESNPFVTVIPTEQEGAEASTASPKENEASTTIPKEKEASAAISKEETAADLASGPLANKHQSSLEVNASDSPRSPVDM